MKRFTLKETEAKEVLNLKDTLEFLDDVITLDVHDFQGTSTAITYIDKNGNCYRKEFIDMYYEEIAEAEKL